MIDKKTTTKTHLVLSTLLLVSFLFSQCTEQEVLLNEELSFKESVVSATSTTCACTYTVPATQTVIDGALLGIKPGAVICFNAAAKYTKSITFKNIIGNSTSPITIKNCGGTVNLTVSGLPWNLKFSNSKFFRLTGGSTPGQYGIRISGSTSNGLVLTDLSTNFEVDHVEVYNVGFAGIMAKTDPSCNNATNRGYFTMRNISIHDNYVHHTKGEGFYIGHNFYDGYKTACGLKLPHVIEGCKIYKNVVTYTGWDGIQVSSVTKGAEIFDNKVENYGTAYQNQQNIGIALGAGTGGTCYGNFIKNGSGHGLTIFGLADNIAHNNVIINAGQIGIFVDERTTTVGAGYKIFNNTIVNPKWEGMRIYSDKVPLNLVINNIVVNPGTFAKYGTSSYIMKLNFMTNVQMSNNYTTRNISDVKFINAGANNYRLSSTSPAINKGKSISTFNVPKDFYATTRLKGAAYDIGASEY